MNKETNEYITDAGLESVFRGFAGQTVKFEHILNPKFRFNGNKIADIDYFEVSYKDSIGGIISYNILATNEFKRKILMEKVLPWSLDGYFFSAEVDFDKDGVATDYRLIVNKPAGATRWEFELEEEQPELKNVLGEDSSSNAQQMGTVTFQKINVKELNEQGIYCRVIGPVPTNDLAKNIPEISSDLSKRLENGESVEVFKTVLSNKYLVEGVSGDKITVNLFPVK